MHPPPTQATQPARHLLCNVQRLHSGLPLILELLQQLLDHLLAWRGVGVRGAVNHGQWFITVSAQQAAQQRPTTRPCVHAPGLAHASRA